MSRFHLKAAVAFCLALTAGPAFGMAHMSSVASNSPIHLVGGKGVKTPTRPPSGVCEAHWVACQHHDPRLTTKK